MAVAVCACVAVTVPAAGPQDVAVPAPLQLEALNSTVAVAVTVHNSSLFLPTGFSLSEDVATTCSFIFTEYDQDPKVLSSSYEGLKSPKEVGKIDLVQKNRKSMRLDAPSGQHLRAAVRSAQGESWRLAQ